MAKEYWKSLAEREGGEQLVKGAETEFAETPLRIGAGPNRRGFLKAAGFTFGASMLAGCGRAPEQKAAPSLVQLEGILPGRPTYYASTCTACPAGCGMLVKTRDGRPIKLEGNPEHPISKGGLCAVGQASILGLYDSQRFKQPLIDGKPAAWDEVDVGIRAELDGIRATGGAVRFLTGTVNSPAVERMIGEFLKGFRDARHIQYDALSSAAILDAHEQTHGVRAIPRFHFEKAEAIVSFDADFLGTWISPVEFAAGYSAARNPESTTPPLAWHAQIEARMSVTGSKADRRIIAAPDRIGGMVEELLGRIESGKHSASPDVEELAVRLLASRGRSLVLCGSHDVSVQLRLNHINHLLGNYGSTIDMEQPSYQRRGSDGDVENLLAEARAGKIAALFVAGANPLYDLPGGDALKNVPLTVSFAERADETARISRYVCPDRHALESWGDVEAVKGVVSFIQPAIRPLTHARQLIETLAVWNGAPRSAREMVQPDALERGFVTRPNRREVSYRAATVRERLDDLPAGDWQLVLYPKTAMLDGRHAYNAWLQELPDPVTKVTWDNYACLAPAAAARLGVAQGNVVRIQVQGQTLELPAVIQPGQHERTIAVALGYGSRLSERFANVGPRWIEARPTLGANGRVGHNAAPLLAFAEGRLSYARAGVAVSRTGRHVDIAATQDHHTLAVPAKLAPAGGGVRPVIQEMLTSDLQDARASNGAHEELWPPDHPYTGHRWAMVVDLNACTGCSACVVACQVENNTPVVGKDEIRRSREMHWMRIDRYYSGEPEAPDVAHQPMFCQHCEHAGCETVCPVLATVHSAEGLNQQVYNRCVGTRYCANNCAYKARRFNWFEYAREDRLANMVLNPDVTVRTRGVMEKCTFCVQRIQEAKIEAKRKGRPLGDGEIQTACQQSCPANAIVFGDLNDPKSRVSQLMRSGRRYRVLEEINTRPSVGYLKVVRNRPARRGGEHHA